MKTRPGARRLLAAALTTGAVVASASAIATSGAVAASPSALIAQLNRERAAAGLPGQVAFDAGLSRSCDKHNRWMSFNSLAHEETRGSRGYTRDGDEAGRSSVLSSGSWTGANPWINAPIHLAQAYDPGLAFAGAASSHGFACLTTWPGISTPVVGADTVWTFPGDGQAAPYAQNAAEWPYIPQQRIGLSGTRTTGPYLYLWAASPQAPEPPDGPEPIGTDAEGFPVYDTAGYEEALAQIENWPRQLDRIVSARLVDARGRNVPVRVIDRHLMGGYLASGLGWVLPPRPLKPRSRYRVTVTLSGGKRERLRTYEHSWTFRTSRVHLGPF